jgi:glycosyltransferase involved in cell wall biosynthesis
MSRIDSRPWITVVIATYNSSRFLPNLAKALDEQTRPDAVGSMEILAIDGGSMDNTRVLAEKFGFKVLENSAGHAIAAKHIGLLSATSRLVCFLDHDELFTTKTALMDRYLLFNKYHNLRAMISAGYLFSPRDSTSNMYASEFGDPVSLQSYRCPNNAKFRIKSLSRRLQVEASDGKAVLLRASSETKPILCEMAAGSGVVDVDYFRQIFPNITTEENTVPHLYYLLGREQETDLLGVIGGDFVSHDSAENWKTVRKKISWRINNAINSTEIAGSGLSGRSHSEIYSPKRQILKFGIYCLSIIGPLLDSIYLALTRKRIGYLNHFFLTYFVVFETIRLKLRVKLKRKTIGRYGES